jgi:hypothetical protein
LRPIIWLGEVLKGAARGLLDLQADAPEVDAQVA